MKFPFTKSKMATGGREFGSSKVKFLCLSKSKFFEFFEFHFWFSFYCIFLKIHKIIFGFFNQIIHTIIKVKKLLRKFNKIF